MTQWLRRGLRTGIKSTAYPARPEGAPGVSPGFPAGREADGGAAALVESCPTGAIQRDDAGGLRVDSRRCVHCYRCARRAAGPLPWVHGYEWAMVPEPSKGDGPLGGPFGRSSNVIVVDAGDCGACLSEVRLLNNPYYNMHRLGFFITPTPRLADILIVVGPVTDHMRLPLMKTWDAMPSPKRVVAVGACALSGGVFGPSFVSGEGAKSVLPVDVEVPGQPPPPLAILHGLLVAVGRRPAAAEPASPPGSTCPR